jgi:cell division transport system permease protein
MSMSLVLFLLASVGYLVAAAITLARNLEEQVTLTVELMHGADSEMTEQVREALQREPRVRTIDFSTREQKAADSAFREMFEHEFEEILEENPLLDSFEVQLAAPNGEEESVEAIIARLEQLEGVERVSYPAHMAERLYRTVGKIRFVLILFGGALLVISLILLANTIRLAIYSKRYLINTMKLVGATKWYIMRPFLGDAVVQGIWAGLGAAILFGASLYGLNETVPELTNLATLEKVGAIVGAMIGLGCLLSLLFTALAVNRFVNMKSSKIYLY